MRRVLSVVRLAAFCLVTSVIPARGQGPAARVQEPPVYDGPPFSLSAALSETLVRNPELIALRASLEAARLRPAQERFLAPPTLEAQIWQWPLNSLNPADTNMYMFMLTQELPGRGKRRLREALATSEVALTDAGIAVRAREVVNEVKQAYAELFVARRAVDAYHASADILRQFADVSTIKYEVGRISQQDVLKAVVELSRLHESLVTLDEQARIAQARLNVLLDRTPQSAIGPLADPAEDARVPALDDLQRLALERQPALRAARLEVERAEAALAVVDRDLKPDFMVTGGYMLMPRDRDAWMATFGLTWPNAPWSRGRMQARKAEATADIEAARARVRAAENRARQSVHNAYVRVTAAAGRAALLRTTVIPQSRQTLDVSRIAYQADQVDLLNLLDTRRTLLDAQLSYFRALADLEAARADLELAVGLELTR